MDDRIWNLVGKMLAGEATADEVRELQHSQCMDADIAFRMEEISRWWHTTNPSENEGSEEAFQKHFERLKDEGLLSSSSNQVSKRSK